MPAVEQPENLGRLLAEIDRRLRTLETAQRAAFTSITDENGVELVRFGRDGVRFLDASGSTVLLLDATGLRMFDADAQRRVHIGEIDVASYGAAVYDADGVTPRFHVDERGINSPYLAAPFRGIVGDVQSTTSGTFTAVFATTLEQIVSPAFYVTVLGNGDVGTSGEMRLQIPLTGAVTDAVPILETGSQQQFRWLHGLALSMGPVNVNVEARRTTGTGNIYVARPSGLWQATDSLASADGVP